jgi:hypothetical protein
VLERYVVKYDLVFDFGHVKLSYNLIIVDEYCRWRIVDDVEDELNLDAHASSSDTENT